jgi:branched-chain amino acid aminotransferase
MTSVHSYINGWPAEEAGGISPADRCFRYGDGLFETMRVVKGRMWNEAFHRQRMAHGIAALGMDYTPLWPTGKQPEGLVRVAVSRGSGGRGYLPPPDAQPMTVVEHFPAPPFLCGPASLWLSQWRRPAASSLPHDVKHASGLNSVLARQEADTQGCDEALLLSQEGWVAEASSANIFWHKGGRWFTPALEVGVLPGSVRHWLMQQVKVEEGFYRLPDLLAADGVVLTNVGWGLWPVASLKPHGHAWQLTDEVRALRIALLKEWGMNHADA